MIHRSISHGADVNLIEDDLQTLQDRAREHRPELKSMQLRRDMNSAGVTAARGGWYPQIFLAANYDYARPNQRIIPPKDRWDGTWDVGVYFQWNVWDWYCNSIIKLYKQKQRCVKLKQVLHNSNDAVTLDVAQQYFNAQTAKEKVDVAFGGMAAGTGIISHDIREI